VEGSGTVAVIVSPNESPPPASVKVYDLEPEAMPSDTNVSPLKKMLELMAAPLTYPTGKLTYFPSPLKYHKSPVTAVGSMYFCVGSRRTRVAGERRGSRE
jgi:hypothetical protein